MVINKNAGTCPICGKPLYESDKGTIFCSGWKNDGCGFIFNRKMAGHVFSPAEVEAIESGRGTDVINNFVSKTGKNFSARVVVDKNAADGRIVHFQFPEDPSDKFCPACHGQLMKSKYRYHCNGCGFSFPVALASHEFTQDEINQLYHNGYVYIEGFVSKKGKTFNTNVLYDKQTGTLDFDFKKPDFKN